MTELNIRLIPGYSPQARGRSERNFRTWQGRLPQELRIRNLDSLAAANEFLRTSYIAFFNAQFAHEAKEAGTAFTTCRRDDLELVFALHHERTVARDNTVEYGNRVLQIEKTKWRFSLAGCKVTIYQHADHTISIGYGPHIVGRYDDTGQPLAAAAAANRRAKQAAKKRSARTAKQTSCGNAAAAESDKKRRFPQRLGKVPLKNSVTFPHSHSYYYWINRWLKQKTKPDISLATKSGHFNLLPTQNYCDTALIL